MNEDFLLSMKSHPLWPIVKKELLSKRPMIPSHNHDKDNTELWKARSAEQRGFDICLALLQINED